MFERNADRRSDDEWKQLLVGEERGDRQVSQAALRERHFRIGDIWIVEQRRRVTTLEQRGHPPDGLLASLLHVVQGKRDTQKRERFAPGTERLIELREERMLCDAGEVHLGLLEVGPRMFERIRNDLAAAVEVSVQVFEGGALPYTSIISS